MESKDMSKAKAVSTNKVKKSREDWIFDIILYTIGVLLIIITLYPMYFIIIASFSDPAAVSNGQIMFLPKGVNFKGYKQLASYAKLWTGYRNTIAYVIMGTLVTLVVNVPASYALSRKHLYGRRFFTAFYLIPMFFTGGLIPTYLAVQRFHLLDTFWVMVVPFSVVTYYIIVGRTFFNNSIPEDLWEAAQLDGCGYLGFFFKIVLPLSKAVIAVIALWAAVGQWNSWFDAMLYNRMSTKLTTLQYELMKLLSAVTNQGGSAETLKNAVGAVTPTSVRAAATIITMLPIICIYPFLQKYFVTGLTLGGVKE